MVFSSSVFLFAFLPLVLTGYFLCRGTRARNAWLLAASLFFYAWGEPVYVFLMMVCIVVNWAFAKAIEGAKEVGRKKRVLLIVAIVIDILIIGFFKYEGFVARTVNAVAGSSIVADLQLPLPIGISFYTLQALSYVIDVYRGRVHAQRNIAVLGMYIACFPQLIAGPIVRYADIEKQVAERSVTIAGVAGGMRLFVVGLAKKVLLANVVAILATDMLSRGGADIGTVGAWCGILAYAFQIYFDFSGYSDMAIGLGRMLGFTYRRNFNYPYIATSAREFWRRWHISLSSFFRDYLYIPLGGNRAGTLRWVLNMLVVWSVTGLWHGAAWNFVLWGTYWGVLLIGERLLWGRLLDRLPRLAGHAYALLVIIAGWTFFSIEDIPSLVAFWQAMLGGFGFTGSSTFWELGVWEYIPVFVVCCLASTPLIPWIHRKLGDWAGQGAPAACDEGDAARVRPLWDTRCLGSESLCDFTPPHDCLPSRRRVLLALGVACDAALLLLLVLSAMSVIWGSFNPFIYFRF